MEDNQNVVEAIQSYGEAMASMGVARYEYRKSQGSEHEEEFKKNLEEMRARVAQKKLDLTKIRLSASILLNDLDTCCDFLAIDES